MTEPPRYDRPSGARVPDPVPRIRRATASVYDSFRGGSLQAAVEAAAFWASILVPACYLPLLLVGPDGTRIGSLALVCLHVVALVVGHPHARRDGS